MTKPLKRIIILGGLGDGLVVASALQDLRASGENVVPYGFLNDFEKQGSRISGIPVLDKIENAKKFLDQEEIFFIAALLKVKETYYRAKKIEDLEIPKERYFTLLHPSATVSKSAKIGHGTFVGPHVTIMPEAVIGNHCSFRASASVGHDCMVGNDCYMGPNSTLSSRVKRGDGVHIGPNACVLEKVGLGPYSVVGLGSAVLKDLPAFVVAFGCPVKIIETLEVEVLENGSAKASSQDD
jgi:acetyltransferase EpsM